MADSQSFWRRVTELFEQALQLSTEVRAKFLATECAGDAELLREVESLLAEHGEQASFLEKPAVASLEDATELFSSLSARLPQQIGPYKVVKSLGAGGMGEVYLAHDERLERPVAVKLLSGYGLAEAERIRRFRREALAASALNHPNILTIYEIGEADGKNFIATEFVEGETLLDLIRSGPVSVKTAIDLTIQIAGALSVAHAAGIIHRDIKPANIMVRPDGLAKVLDFGIAKYDETQRPISGDQSQLETAAGTVIGTAAYMSPEQARGYPIDQRTDLWSLGVILYELLTGVRPFQGETVMDTIAAVIERHPAPLAKYGTVAPDLFEGIVFKALQKNRDERYQSANQLLEDLKTLARTVESADASAPNRAASTSQIVSRPGPPISVAVLPFVNMSADPENEYFCDGLSEELLNALTRIENLKVAARTSAFSFKGKDATVSGIGRALNVSSVLEGSVRKSGNRLRITVQLVNAADGYHIWSERYDRELEDIFDVQDEIALSVVDALKVKLLGAEKAAVLKRYTENVEAYQLYLKGRYYWWKTTPEDFHKSREFFQRAVEADPAYALGYCGLSSYYGFGSAWGLVPPDTGWPSSIEANRKAMELDDSLAEVHNDLAGISMVFYRDPAATEREARRAVELNPGFQEIHYLYSFYLLTRAQFEAAIGEARKAVELDPLSVRVNNHLAYSYYLARRYDEAIAQFRQALELDENNPAVHEGIADALELKGEFDSAVAHRQKALKLTGEAPGAEQLQTSYARSGFENAMRAWAERTLEQLKTAAAAGAYVPAIKFVRLYLRLGVNDQAFAWLEKACAERNVFPLLIQADPVYDSLRPDPFFQTLLRRFELTVDGSDSANAAPTPETSRSARVPTLPEDDQPKETREQQATTAPDTTRKNGYLILGGLIFLLVLVVAGLIYRSYANRPQIQSIAVLPFVNESGNSDVEYLSDGMTDMLITSLSQLPQLSVKARSSVFRYKGKDTEPQQLGKELNVQAILTGRLVQHGNELTLHIELVNVKTETALWSGDYNRSMTNLATLQGEIARDVSRKLRARLSGAEEQKVARNYTDNAEAYQLYLRGRFHYFRLTRPELDKAIEFYQQAIALDRSYALAYTGIAQAYRALALTSDVPSNEAMPKAKAAALRAIEIDETLAEAHTALGVIAYWFDWDWKAAEGHFLRALELNPDSASHMGYAQLLSSMGQHEKALVEAKRAIDLEPLNLRNNAVEGQALFFAGRYDESIDRLKKTIELDASLWLPHMFLAKVYIEKKMYAEAVAEANEAKTLSGGSAEAVAHVVYALAKSGKQAEARATLDQLRKRAAERDVPPYAFALSYNGLGASDEAIAWLGKGLEQRDVRMALLTVDPKWNNLRADPRFQALLKRAGFMS